MLNLIRCEFWKLKRKMFVQLVFAQIITTTFSSKDIRLADANNLYLYNTTLPVAKINRSFIEAGIDIQEAHLCEDTLEDYFKKITGGEGIA